MSGGPPQGNQRDAPCVREAGARPHSALGTPLLFDVELAGSGGYVRSAARRLAAGADKGAHTWGRMDALSIQHLAATPDASWGSAPSPGEVRLLGSLLASAERRVRSVNNPQKLGTAFTFLEKFGLALPSRPLWRRRGGSDDWEAAAHNNQTFEALGEFIRRVGSIRPGLVGEPLLADTVSDYLGTLSAAFETELSAPLKSTSAAARAKRVKRSWHADDGPRSVQRVLRRLGFRGQHFKRALLTFDRVSTRGRFRWMLALLMYYCLMRAGEPGRGSGAKPFNASRGVRLCDVEWWDASITPDNLPAVCFMLVSSKPGAGGRYVRKPCEVSARPDGDPALCGYSCFLAYWRERRHAVCVRPSRCSSTVGFCSACQSAPLYVDPDGVVPTTQSCLDLARELCVSIGEPPEDYSGYSWRIGCATDMVAKFGEEKAARVTKRRGRWDSDIYHIYERSDVGEQLRASASVIDAEGHTLESLLPQWVQPGRQWPR